jgi:hypothetical protein
VIQRCNRVDRIPITTAETITTANGTARRRSARPNGANLAADTLDAARSFRPAERTVRRSLSKRSARAWLST